MKIRFLADADLNRAIANGVVRREPSIDFLTAHGAGLRALHDLDVLAPAAEQQRVLVSHDVGTMPAHFVAFRDSGRQTPGVFLIPQNCHVGTAIDQLVLLWSVSEASERHGRLVSLPL